MNLAQRRKKVVRWACNPPLLAPKIIRRHGLANSLWGFMVCVCVELVYATLFGCDCFIQVVLGCVPRRIPRRMAPRFLRLSVPWTEPYRDRTGVSRRDLEKRRRDQFFNKLVVNLGAATASNCITPQSAAAAIALRTSPPSDYFFGRLPFEMRDAIYCLAFPPRMLHMYLRYGKSEPRRSSERPGAGIAGGGREDVEEEWEVKRWLWAGSVCRRPPDGWRPADLSHGRRRGTYAFCESRILSDDFSWTKGVALNEQCSDDADIGILGWLRSCRQAYVEGMRHLYAENTIILCSPPLLRGFQDLVSPSITSLLTSLEMTWNTSNFLLLDGFTGNGHANLDTTIPNQPRTTPVFPSLRYLRIFLRGYDTAALESGNPCPSGIAFGNWIATYTPLKLDKLIPRIAPPAAEVCVEYNYWGDYKNLDMKLIREQGIDVTQPQICQDLGGLKCWRQIPAAATTAATTSSSVQPKTPTDSGRGYWCHIGPAAIHTNS